MTGRRELDNVKSSMDPMALNNLVVSMRGILKKARLQVIHKLSRQSAQLKKKKGTESQVAANVKKAARLVDEIKHIKAAKLDQVAKKALANTSRFEDIAKEANTSLQERAEMRVVTHQLVTSKVAEWREKHEDWKSLAAFILSKNTGRRYKKKKKKDTEQESALARKPWDVTVDVAPPSGQLVKDKPLSEKLAQKHEAQSLQDESPSVQNPNRLKESLNDRQSKMEVDSDGEEETEDESDDDDAESESDVEGDTSPVIVRPHNKKENVHPSDSSRVTCDSSSKPDVTDRVPSAQNSHEMVIKKFSLDEFSDDEESIPIKSIKSGPDDGETVKKESDSEDDDGLTQLTKKPSQNRKKDSFFLTADGEVDSSDSEADDDNQEVDDEDDDDEDGDESNSHKAKLTESMFVGALSQGRNQRGRRGGSQREGKYERQPNRPQYQRGGRGSYHPYRSDRGGHSRGRKQAAGPERPGRPASKPVHLPSKPAVQESSKPEEKMHPSWEASRRKKEQQKSIQAFQGKKITFDDD